MAVIDLRFIAIGKAGFKLGAEIHARVPTLAEFDLGLELAILALLFHVVEMAAVAISDDRAVFHRPALWILTRFPAIKSLAVEHALPTRAGVIGGRGKSNG